MWWLSSSSTKVRSNLERFLRGTTPKPPSFSLSQSCEKDLNSLWIQESKDETEYFRLSDLWDCFDEPSAYGIGSKVDLNNGESVMQYYAPYLSAIQIYTNKPPAISRNQSEVVDFESECWSDDSETEKLSRSTSSGSSKILWDSSSDDSGYEIDGIASSLRDKLGYIEFQYFESAKPHLRVPLTAKVNELTEKYPGLLTLRSVDLSPASWMAIAWYPIYHIPSRKTDKDLTTCFLSYHTLSSAFQGNLAERDDESNKIMEEETLCCDNESVTKRLHLDPFGLVTYKLHGGLWGNQESRDQERLVYLRSAADSWLKQLNVHNHHDHSFFSMNKSL